MFALLLICAVMPPQFPDRPKVLPPQFPAPPCGVAGCDCGCLEGNDCTCRPDGMKSTVGIGLPYTVYRQTGLCPGYFVSNRIPPRNDGQLFNYRESAQAEADRLNGLKSYAQWKANLKKRGNPQPGLAPRPVTFAPVFMPSFAPSFGGGFAGAACRGGG